MRVRARVSSVCLVLGRLLDVALVPLPQQQAPLLGRHLPQFLQDFRLLGFVRHLFLRLAEGAALKLLHRP
jgi:hypothetical protein